MKQCSRNEDERASNILLDVLFCGFVNKKMKIFKVVHNGKNYLIPDESPFLSFIKNPNLTSPAHRLGRERWFIDGRNKWETKSFSLPSPKGHLPIPSLPSRWAGPFMSLSL